MHWQVVQKRCVLRGVLWLIGVVVDAKHLYPFTIIKVFVSVCEGAVEELVDLEGCERRDWAGVGRHLLLVHALSDVAHPLAELVGLDGAGVCLVEALKCLFELYLWVELDETLAHHGEEHGEVDALVGGAWTRCEECVEGGLGGRYAWRWWGVRWGQGGRDELTETGERLAEVVDRDDAILVVVDELEGLFELLYLRGLEKGEEAGWLPSGTRLWGHGGSEEAGMVSGVGRGQRTWQERRSPILSWLVLGVLLSWRSV